MAIGTCDPFEFLVFHGTAPIFLQFGAARQSPVPHQPPRGRRQGAGQYFAVRNADQRLGPPVFRMENELGCDR
ncbi:MAG TPA: hypothetical protein VG889_01240 [Rhizomicrobium sp.]|nr:hypothetical protein [Rhizomicrobium sp.]